MPASHNTLLTGALLAFAALTALVLSAPPPPADWCTIQGQAHATAGQLLRIRIDVGEPLGDSRLYANLHWLTARKEDRRFLLAGRVEPVPGLAQTYDVTFDIPVRADLAYVFAVVFASPTQSWREHTRHANSAPIAVRPAGAAAASSELVAWRTYDPTAKATSGAVAESRAARVAAAALWLGCAFLAYRLRAAVSWARPSANASIATAARLFAAVSIAAALWELSPAAQAIGRWGRKLAVEEGFYDERRPLQLVVTTAAATAIVGLILLTLGRTRTPLAWRVAWLGFWLYAGTAIVGFLSLHNADALLATGIAGLPAQQIAKLAGAAIALVGLCLANVGSLVPPRQSAIR